MAGAAGGEGVDAEEQAGRHVGQRLGGLAGGLAIKVQPGAAAIVSGGEVKPLPGGKRRGEAGARAGHAVGPEKFQAKVGAGAGLAGDDQPHAIGRLGG